MGISLAGGTAWDRKRMLRIARADFGHRVEMGRSCRQDRRLARLPGLDLVATRSKTGTRIPGTRV